MRFFLLTLLLLSLAAPAARAARAWQAPVQLSGAGDTWSGDAAVAPDGRVVAAWTERAGETEQAWLTVRPGLAPVMIDAVGRAPQVAVGGTGEAVVAWEHGMGSGILPHTSVALWTPEGGLGEPIDLGASGWARGLDVDANARGDMVVAFIREENYAPVLYSAFRPAGGSFGPPVKISASESVVDLDVALGGSGEAIFAWIQQTAESGYVAKAASRLMAAAPSPVTVLSSPGKDALGARAAADGLGRGVVTFREEGDHEYSGWVRAHVKSAVGVWAPATGVDGYTDGAPAVGVDGDGDVVLTWGHFKPSPDGNGGQLGPLRLTRGRLDTGAFEPGYNLAGLDAPYGTPSVAVREDGTSVVAWEDFGTGEVRTSRREGTAAFGPVQTVRCPSPRATPRVAGIDAAGTASVIYRRGDVAPAVRPWWLVQDAAADAPSPAACPPNPARKPYPIYNPMMPAPGQEVSIDVEGTHDPDAVKTTWQWDMDNDGTFETDTGTSPVLRHVYATEGYKQWQLAATTTFGQGGAGTAIWTFGIQVGRPSLPPMRHPQPASKAVAGVTLPPGQKLAAVVKGGLRATVVARDAGPANVELWADAKEARRLRLGRKATRLSRRAVLLEAGSAVTVRLKLTRAAVKRLRKARRATLGLGLVRDGLPLATTPVKLRR